MILCFEQTVKGFSTSGPHLPSHLSTLDRQQRQHSFAWDVSLNAARRRRVVDDDTTANSTNTTNPKLRGIRQRNVGQTPRSWMENYEALLEYKRSHQHCRVPAKYSLDLALGSWVSVLRLNGREKVSLEQLELLDEAGFDWESKDERNNRLWQESYQKLIEYEELYGDCCVPYRYESDKALGLWVYTQRRYRKQGRLRADREEQLDAILFTWSVKDGTSHVNTTRADRLWNETFDRLLEFREEWGHCLVPKPFDEDPLLGTWVSRQRDVFQKGLLRLDRQELLEDIGFVFEPTHTKQNLEHRHWNLMFQRLVDYNDENGHTTNVKYDHEEFGLGSWVSWQRRNKDVMDEKRRKRLDAIGFQWSYRGFISWQERFEELRKYSIVHGTCNVKKKENISLARWVYQQRHLVKTGKMTLERGKKLESIGFE